LGKLQALGITIPPDTPTATTSRGLHFFFSGSVPDRVALLPGIDVRGVGYVVAAPSTHATGLRYTWLKPLVYPFPKAPEALLSLCTTPTQQKSLANANGTTNWLMEALGGANEGARDVTCTRLAGYFLGKGMPADAVESILLGWSTRCVPPMD